MAVDPMEFASRIPPAPQPCYYTLAEEDEETPDEPLRPVHESHRKGGKFRCERRGKFGCDLTALGVLGLASRGTLPKDALIPALNNPNPLEWILRCFSAAVTEEIAFRFGLMSLFVWSARSVVRNTAIQRPSLWMANLLSALVFSAAHFPQLELARYGASLLIPFVVSSSGVGMIMGWLFVRYGLGSAIVAHLAVDLVANVLPRLG